MYKKTELGVDAFKEGAAQTQIEFCGKLEIRASCKLCVRPVPANSPPTSSPSLVRSATRKLRLALEGDRRPPLALYTTVLHYFPGRATHYGESLERTWRIRIRSADCAHVDELFNSARSSAAAAAAG